MKKKIFICALFISLITTAQTTVTKSLGDFNIIKVYNGIEVELIKSTGTADRNYWREIRKS